MKNSLYILLSLCSFTLFAQKKVTQKQADKLIATKQYVTAAAALEQLDKTKTNLQHLADCYYYNFQMEKATKAYDQLFATYKDSLDKEIYFRYANALKGIQNFDKGDKIMTEYIGYEENTARFMKNVTRTSLSSFKLTIMSKSKSNGDFGIAFYGDKVAFASARDSKNKAYGWNAKPYLDLFTATVDDEGQLTNIEPFSDKINSKKHESNIALTKDGKTMYFNRTSDKQVKIGNEVFASVKLFKAELVNGKWDNITMLPFSNDAYSVEHPALSIDEKKLYFASDMPSSKGSFDIYEVDINPDGTYSEPRNLGDIINTKHREQFPFIGDDGSLYFASDGHQGYGNLDVFIARQKSSTEFDKPLNMGSTLNSPMDDFNFILNEKEDKGYFASNREGDDNLYTFIREKNKLLYLVDGEVRDKKTSEILPGATVKLFNEKGELVEEIVVGKDGTFNFNTEPNKKYKLMAFKDFYIPAETEFETTTGGKVYIDLQMKVESYYDAEDIINKKEDGSVLIELENIYFDLDKWNIKPQAAQVLDVLVDILKKYPYMEIEIGSHTDNRASDLYNLRLSNKRAASSLEYLVAHGIDRKRLTSVGYGETKLLIICPKNDCTEEEHATNRRSTFRIVK
jgi:peptidoglycan-associated lipoprotein